MPSYIPTQPYNADEEVVYEKSEVEAAIDLVSNHRYNRAFTALDTSELEALAARLFAGEDFEAFRFNAEDVRQACDGTGVPLPEPGDMDSRLYLTIWAARHLLDDEQRQEMSRRLQQLLPKYAQAGQLNEASLILQAAQSLVNRPGNLDHFIFNMFGYGLLDVQKRLDAIFEGEELPPPLRLSEEEMLPIWYDALEDVKPFREDYREMWEKMARSKPGFSYQRLGDKLRLEVEKNACQLAPILFTPQRVAQLQSDLKDYQQVLAQQGDEQNHMQEVLAWLEVDKPADEHPFLLAVCYHNLMRALQAADEENPFFVE